MEQVTMFAKDAAKYLGISYDTLLGLSRQGIVPSLKIGRRYVFRKETLDLWMKNQEIASVQPEAACYGKLRKVNA